MPGARYAMTLATYLPYFLMDLAASVIKSFNANLRHIPQDLMYRRHGCHSPDCCEGDFTRQDSPIVTAGCGVKAPAQVSSGDELFRLYIAWRKKKARLWLADYGQRTFDGRIG